MDKVTITNVRGRYATNQQKEPYKTKAGKPFKKVLIEVEGYDNIISLLDFDEATANWKEGDEVELEIETVEKDGKTYYNGRLPRRSDVIEQRLTTLEEKMGKVAKAFQAMKKRLGEIETGRSEDEETLNESRK